MQLHTYVMGRLTLWSIWVLAHRAHDNGGRARGPARVRSWWSPMVLERNMGVSSVHQQAGRSLRVNEAEAMETDACVQALAPELREAIALSYLCTGTVGEKADAIGLQRRAFYYRLERAYAELLGLFNDRAAARKNILTPLHSLKENVCTLV